MGKDRVYKLYPDINSYNFINTKVDSKARSIPKDKKKT